MTPSEIVTSRLGELILSLTLSLEERKELIGILRTYLRPT